MQALISEEDVCCKKLPTSGNQGIALTEARNFDSTTIYQELWSFRLYFTLTAVRDYILAQLFMSSRL